MVKKEREISTESDNAVVAAEVKLSRTLRQADKLHSITSTRNFASAM